MKKYTALIIVLCIFLNVCNLHSQVAVNIDGSSPDSSAMLDVKSTNSGFLLPRMNTIQISGITNPAAGLMAFNTDSSDFYGFNGAKWISIWDSSDTLSDWYCGNTITDSRDGKVYKTVLIGTQCWVAENLNIGTMISGSSNQTDNSIIEKYCYNDDAANCTIYGGLYQWDEMMQYVTTESTQGICPQDWHLPSDNEYKVLEMKLGMTQAQANAGGWRGTNQGSQLAGNAALWDNGPSHPALENNSAFGTSGFLALPGGSRDNSGSFLYQGVYAYFRSSTESGTPAEYRSLIYYLPQISRSTSPKANGFSVRCVRD